MATQFNTKSPTIKRILKEASELASNASPDYHAEPLESNLFEWHFTLRGPPAPSPYAGGIYHGRIVLPSSYPLRPPSFRFLTPSGRFEANREICLSISGFHEETWQPAWGIRTALVAIRSFMDTDPKGQVGGMDCTETARKSMAVESVHWKCASCGKSNAQIMKEREEAAGSDDSERPQEEVPEELRLAYREDLGKDAPKDQQASSPGGAPQQGSSELKGKEKAGETPSPAARPSPSTNPQTTTLNRASTRPAIGTVSTTTVRLPAQQRITSNEDGVPAWVDKAIIGVLAALIIMILRKFVL